MKKKILVYFVGIMVACTILGRVANGMSMPRVSVERPKADTIAHTVRSVGVIEKNAEEGVYIIPNMRINKVHVNAGDTVEEGDTLLEADMDILETELTAKENELKKLELQKADDESQNKVSAENRERNIRHATDSYNQTVANADAGVLRAQQEYEDAKRAYDNAGDISVEEVNALVADVNAKVAALDQALQAREDAILSATQALEVAQADEPSKSTQEGLQMDEDMIEKDISKLQKLKDEKGIIKATVDGVVTQVLVGTGEQTGVTAAVLLADNSKGYRFVTQVTKDQNKYLSVGQTVSLTPSGEFQAIAKMKIDSIIATAEDAETMQVTITVDPEQFHIGESVEMTAVHEAKMYPICLPISALGEENKSYFVYLVEEEKTILGEALVVRKQQVTVMDKNEKLVAVAAGDITTGQNVVVDANKKLQDGTRIRADES
jgi:hypothetical protein